jgi:hypothetical protein
MDQRFMPRPSPATPTRRKTPDPRGGETSIRIRLSKSPPGTSDQPILPAFPRRFGLGSAGPFPASRKGSLGPTPPLSSQGTLQPRITLPQHHRRHQMAEEAWAPPAPS